MLAKYIIPMQISADQTLKFMCTLRFAYLHKAAKRGEQPVKGEWAVGGGCSGILGGTERAFAARIKLK